MTNAQSSLDRLMELLSEQMERTLNTAEEHELQELLVLHPEWGEDDFWLASTAIDMAYSSTPEEMPAEIADRVIQRAHGYFAAVESAPPRLTVVEGDKPAPKAQIPATPPEPEPVGTPWWVWGGWAVAAASILLALFALLGDPPKAPQPPAGPTLAQARTALSAEQGAAVMPWSGTEDALAKGVAGDVVWSDKAQKGYMRFVGLEKNDPTKQQYQLWIFDEARNEAHPVDGGVFDSNGGELIVPIDPRVPVTRSTLFAITLEKPGGVVVSTRERLILVAKPG